MRHSYACVCVHVLVHVRVADVVQYVEAAHSHVGESSAKALWGDCTGRFLLWGSKSIQVYDP